MKDTIIVLKQSLFKDITDQEVLETIKVDENEVKVEIVELKYKIISMEEIDALDNAEAMSFQISWVEKILKPLLQKYPGCRIYYFGATTTPLAVHLGYCVGGWQHLEVFNWDRFHNTWRWEDTDGKVALPTTTKYIKDIIEVPTDVLFKVEASFSMQQDAIKESLGSSVQTISLSLNEPDKQAFKNFAQVKEIGQLFSQGIDNIATKIPNAEKIHLIISAPVGVCFYLGTKINPVMTKPVALYQFNANKVPQYEEILILQEEPITVTPLSAEDQVLISRIRVRLKDELQKIKNFAVSKKEEVDRHQEKMNWIDLILPKGPYESLKHGYWKYQPSIADTILTHSTLIDNTIEADKRDGFYIEDNGEWQLSDQFIFNIAQRMDRDEGKTLRALRMFILHEAFHIPQMLTNRTAIAIGRFPRILEEADFIADVWTFIHEYAFSKMHYSSDTQNEKEFFKNLFRLAIETMWSFAALATNNNEIQVRAVNRFLIWYWSFNLVDDPKCKSVVGIVNRLAVKPILELKGLDIKALSQRVIYKLNNPRLSELEIGYAAPDGKIYRHASAAGLEIGEIVAGFRERKSELVFEQIKTLYHIIGPHLPAFE
jgi:hypothetical protein